MIDNNIIAEKNNRRYSMSVDFGTSFILADFDSGADYTVISLDAFSISPPDNKKEKVKEYFSNKGITEKIFQSASGDNISGYPVCAKNVKVGGILFPSFRYYLIINSKRSVALIGYDFIDNCKFSHDYHNDIIIDDFDFGSYNKDFVQGNISEEDILEFIDNLEDVN